MKDNDFIVKTIVTTELIKAVADKNKIEMRESDWSSDVCSSDLPERRSTG